MSEDSHELPEVSAFEAALLRLLHLVLRRDVSRQALSLLYQHHERPRCLSRVAVDLIEDTLMRGCVGLLARGGWRREGFLQGLEVKEGRLWERHEPEALGLSFSAHSLELLIWLTAENLNERKVTWPTFPEEELELGDRLLIYLVVSALREVEGGRALNKWEPAAANLLCRLAFPEVLAASPVPGGVDLYQPFVGESGAWVLEAWQGELTQRLVETERHKAEVTDWQHMQRLGHMQNVTLSGLLEALEKAQRPDLARFLFVALRELLPSNPQLQWWLTRMTNHGPRIADRVETARAALAVVQQTATLQRWWREAQATRFFEEHYPIAKLYLNEWERWQGAVLYERAQQLLHEAQPL